MRFHCLALFAAVLLCGSRLSAADDPPTVAFQAGPGKLVVTVGEKPVATYVYADEEISRPYFAHVCAPGGSQVTRNHPPVKGKDRMDHVAMHPGIWMAFGDLSGSDSWRNRASVVHEGFLKSPTGGAAKGTFAVRNRYVAQGEKERTVCHETCRYTFLVRPAGYLLIWDSTFSSNDGEFYFGDQEEMGLGVRVATPITVDSGGTILDAEGRRNERQVWGQAAHWCDCSGRVDNRWVGITLMCDPANFRPSWFHARDYGLLVANPFGRKAFGKGESSRVVLKQEKPLQLRYGILLHSAWQVGRPDPEEAYADFLRALAEQVATETDD